jgi:hypothetical protein
MYYFAAITVDLYLISILIFSIQLFTYYIYLFYISVQYNIVKSSQDPQVSECNYPLRIRDSKDDYTL